MKRMTNNLNDKTQHGGVAIVMVFIVLVIITGMLVTVLSLSSSAVSDSSHQNFRTKSIYMAESAIEHAEYKLANSTACASIATASQTLGAGSFEVLSGTVGAVADECVVTVKGVQNGFVHTFTRIVSFSAGGGSFKDEFPSSVEFTNDWTTKIIGNSVPLDILYDSNNSPGSVGGSMVAHALRVNKKPNTLKGTAIRLLPTPIDASAGDVTVTYSFNLKSLNETTPGGPLTTHIVQIFALNGNKTEPIWDSTGLGLMDNTATWSSQPSVVSTVLLPGGVTYDSILVKFFLEAPAKNEASFILLDDIELTW